jgi:hypothetical protein
MATYEELYGLRNDSALRNRVTIAVLIAAETVMNELPTVDNHANRLVWASQVFANPSVEADRMFMAVLAANESLTVAQITSASDSAIQANVDDHVDLFATG